MGVDKGVVGAVVTAGVNTGVAAGVGVIGAGVKVNTSVAAGVGVINTGVVVGATTGSVALPALSVPLREAVGVGDDACCCSTDKFVKNTVISVISPPVSLTVLSP